MQAVEAHLLSLLDGKKQFIIPIYQRTYSWTEKQCRQLWEDIVRTAKDDKIPAHFIGSVVYIKKSAYDTPMTSIPQHLVIDGQQRLTTLSLLLIALRDALKKSSGSSTVSAAQIEDYLTNTHGKDELHYKLILTQSDKDTLINLVDGKAPPPTVSPRVAENYRFFQDQIASSGIALGVLYLGVQKLMLVDISLDRDRDNPQLIFESLNSTGLDLSQADLIRNYILMGQDPKEQTDLYNDYWFPMESRFGHAEYAAQFDRFMRDYLTVKMGRIPNMDQVYAEFKVYTQSNPGLSVSDVVADVFRFSGFFVNLAFGRDQDKDLHAAIEDINTLKVDVAYPFLLEAYDDYDKKVISQADLLKVLRLVESYVFRRAICAIPTNSLNKTFAGLRAEVDPTDYVESLEAALLLKDSYRRFPRDDEFKAQLVIRDLYNTRTRNYLLGKLENFGHKEKAQVENYTIEHIMPQTESLAPEWLDDLGTDWKHVHDTYLHTLGNLTLTAYNSEYSARPFLEKRDLVDKNGNACGLASSHIHLNHGLGKLDHWDEARIQARAAQLAATAVKVWECPSLPTATVAKYQKGTTPTSSPKYSYDNYVEKLFGDWLPLFDHLRKRILNLDVTVTEAFQQWGVNYYTSDIPFVTVVQQRTRLRLTMNMDYGNADDPKDIASDAGAKYDWAKGQTLTVIKTDAQMDDVMALVKQAFRSVGGGDDGADES